MKVRRDKFNTLLSRLFKAKPEPRRVAKRYRDEFLVTGIEAQR
jgi:hypothetical protein